MKTYNILIIIPSFYPAIIYGGPIFTSYYTCNELSKLHLSFSVITTNANGGKRLDIKPNIYLQVNDYPVKYYNETIISKFSWNLFRNIKKDIQQTDIVHIQGFFSTPTPISLYWAGKYKKKIIITPHGTLGSWCLKQKAVFKKIWIKYLIKPYLKQIVWHATAESEKHEIQSVFPDANVQIIANGIYLNEFNKFEKIPKNEFAGYFTSITAEASHIIISAGRLQKKKGFDILIKAHFEVLKTFPKALLFIAGEDEGELENLKTLIKNLRLERHVFFTGMISDKTKVNFFANADIFVLPSHNENFGVVYAEALAAGTPIVASTNTPWHEVEEAGCGRWVPNTVKDTTEAILDILKRDRESMRQNALKYVQKFDWKNIALEFKQLYEKLI